MAHADTGDWKTIDSDIALDLQRNIWGENVSEEAFLRWSQGLSFSDDEPSALLQRSGGPCAVLAPLQAYIIKSMIFADENWKSSDIDLQSLTETNVRDLLKSSLYDIMKRVSSDGKCALVIYIPGELWQNSELNGESRNKRPNLFCIENFHQALLCKYCDVGDLTEHIGDFTRHIINDFGVLCLLYSVVLSKGLNEIMSAVNEIGEPLIDPKYGNGGQCIVNLLLTGEATPHVFDGESDVDGLKMVGISSQAEMGFLTLLEAHNYLTVGSYLKCPIYPIWILGNETHLTVFFSKSYEALQKHHGSVTMDTIARYDTEGNGFIDTSNLRKLMSDLNLLCEPDEYVSVITDSLDPEGLGVFLIADFIKHFYPDEDKASKMLPSFDVFHYNGVKRSNNNNKILYQAGHAVITDSVEPQQASDNTPILRCLQTKWPTIQVLWKDDIIPSLN